MYSQHVLTLQFSGRLSPSESLHLTPSQSWEGDTKLREKRIQLRLPEEADLDFLTSRVKGAGAVDMKWGGKGHLQLHGGGVPRASVLLPVCAQHIVFLGLISPSWKLRTQAESSNEMLYPGPPGGWGHPLGASSLPLLPSPGCVPSNQVLWCLSELLQCHMWSC